MQRNTSAGLACAAIACAAIVGGSFGPQDPKAAAWYLTLRKPALTPPGAAIGGIWMVLYGLLGVCGTRLLRARAAPARSVALGFWGATLVGIAAFPFTFFGRRRLDEGTATSAFLLAAAVGTTVSAARVDRTAALCAVPVTVWVAAATLLSEELWRRNTRQGSRLTRQLRSSPLLPPY